MKTPSRFVIIDDDPGTNFLCNLAIKKALDATDIHTFTLPESGVQFIRETSHTDQPSSTVLFLDINMPVMTGWDVLEALSEIGEFIRRQYTIFILSSSINPGDKERAKVSPLVHDYIEKPLTIEKLKHLFSVPETVTQ